MAEVVASFDVLVPDIRKVGLDRPWQWLAAGWRDLVRSPGVSLAFGAVFAAAGYALSLGAWAAGGGVLLVRGLLPACRRVDAKDVARDLEAAADGVLHERLSSAIELSASAPPVMWPSSAPSAVVGGGGARSVPRISAAANRPARSPIAADST